MNGRSHVCFTLEAALENAFEMENRIFADFLGALRTVKSKSAKDILRAAALGKLAEKQRIEKALLEGSIENVDLHSQVPTMNLDAHFGKATLAEEADERESLAYAVHQVTQAVDYYKKMAAACRKAPMSVVFTRISDDQTSLLQQLEDTYEEHFLTEN